MLSTAINVPRLMGRTALGAMNERLMGVPREARATTLSEFKGVADAVTAGGWSGAYDALGQVLGNLLRGRKPVATEQATSVFTGRAAPLGLVLEFGGRARTANDAFIQGTGRNMAIHMLAHREATREGLSGNSYKRRVAQIVDRVRGEFEKAEAKGKEVEQGGTAQMRTTGPGRLRDTADYPALAKEAQAMTKRLIFQQEPGASARSLGGSRGGSLLGFFVLFFKTLANLGAEGLTMTPVGMAGTALDAARGSKLATGGQAHRWAGPYAEADTGGKRRPGHPAARTSNPAVLPASQRWAEHELGLALIATGALAAFAGLLTGEGPEDPDANTQWREEGHRRFALKVGDEEVPVVRLLGPLALPLIMGAVAGEHYRETGELDADLLTDVVGRSTTEWAKMSGLAAFADVFSALVESNDQDKKRLVERALGQQLGSLIPSTSLLRQIEQMTDPVTRDPRTLWENLVSGIPGVGAGLPPERDELGDPVVRSEGETGWRAALPFQGSRPREGLRRFRGSSGPAEDAQVAAALRKVDDYQRQRLTGKPPADADVPTAEEFDIARFYRGKESPEYEKWRKVGRGLEDERKGMPDQAGVAVGELLGRLQSGGGGALRRRGPAALVR